MPEFILTDNRPLRDLSDFESGYIEAMFFTNGDSGDERENLLNELGTRRLTNEALRNIKADCAAFQKAAAPLLELATGPMSGYSDERAGRDFWFTRQGHGVGFWDREELRRDLAKREDGTWTDTGEEEGLPCWGSLGDELTKLAEQAGEVYCQVWRGWIYH